MEHQVMDVARWCSFDNSKPTFPLFIQQKYFFICSKNKELNKFYLSVVLSVCLFNDKKKGGWVRLMFFFSPTLFFANPNFSLLDENVNTGEASTCVGRVFL